MAHREDRSHSPGAEATPIKLRICNGEGERISAASIESVEEAFAAPHAVLVGSEISLTDREHILIALAVGQDNGNVGGEFLLSRVRGDHASLSGPVSREQAIDEFRRFVAKR